MKVEYLRRYESINMKEEGEGWRQQIINTIGYKPNIQL
jgi:hypothetical protein